MQPLKITAILQNGFASSDPWSPSIDGILAYWHQREKLGEEEFAIGMVSNDTLSPVDDLPLKKIGDPWYYACSSPIYDAQATFLRYFHRRFDTQKAEKYMEKKRGRVSVKAGPYKNFRLTSQVHVCRNVTWHVIGDKKKIDVLLSKCHFIGSKVGVGNGKVLKWIVTEGGDPNIAVNYRPVPANENQSGTIMDWGLRPPARINENQFLCVMPE